MKKLQAFQPKRLFYSFLIALPLVLLFSCGNNNNKNKVAASSSLDAGGGGGNDTADCITMTRLQIKTWLSTGWNVPGNSNFIPCLSMTPASDSTGIHVDGFPTNVDTVVKINQRIPYTIKGLTPPCSFPTGLTVNRQYYNFYANGFADGSGNLIPFDYMRLRPRAYSGDSTLMSFDVEIVSKNGGTTVTAKGETYPCPPHCPADQ